MSYECDDKRYKTSTSQTGHRFEEVTDDKTTNKKTDETRIEGSRGNACAESLGVHRAVCGVYGRTGAGGVGRVAVWRYSSGRIPLMMSELRRC